MAVTDTVTLSDGTSAVIKKIGWKAQTKALNERERKGVEPLAVFVPAFDKEQRATLIGAQKEAVKEAVIQKLKDTFDAKPFLRWDCDTVLQEGVVSLDGGEKPTPEQLDDLGPDDVELIVGRIYEMSRPKTEEEQKNS